MPAKREMCESHRGADTMATVELLVSIVTHSQISRVLTWAPPKRGGKRGAANYISRLQLMLAYSFG